MKELGDTSEKMHRKIGSFAAENLDTIIAIGPEARYIAEEAKKTNPSVTAVHFDDNESAKKEMMNYLEKNDTILIKGSHSMNLSEITSFLREMC